MTWLSNAFLKLRATMSSPSPATAGRRAIGPAIQTTTRKSPIQQAPKLVKQAKAHPDASRLGGTTNPDYLAWQKAWEKFGEQPSAHQRLAPYA
ncbi:uncharacterized protein BKCO1_1500092 [Diplodia corticola]|uniref:Uncharacterized protein n=1 Tax=Diplodia corticola TaxID=236234 RepID=A0A1J9R6D4_9PEZI|nr:uncharacterized protein BKCO1_1500092 [Diplodia corticola]OJD35778.1 hypothetical protein BKCO1_1500092 [Diplodia corticola]